MHAFRVTSPAHEPKIIFAESAAQVAEIIVAWHSLNCIDATEFTLDSGWARTLAGVERKHLIDALGWARSAGIGMNYRSDIGWAIGQPRDERGEI